ncbi:MAG: chromate transporter [Clostridia bacterium]|nr:chromate transporter [Clostridia bacterium]
MIYLLLFWTFLKIGLFTFGGGYAMIPMITDEVVNIHAWLSETDVINFIAVSESTPGPFAINMATFVGNSQAGILGGVVATFGVVLPSFIIILVVSAFYARFRSSTAVNGFFTAVKPVVAGLITSAYVTVLCAVILPFISLSGFKVGDGVFDYISLILIAILTAVGFIKIKGKKVHPIILILFSAFVGLIVFGVLGL